MVSDEQKRRKYRVNLAEFVLNKLCSDARFKRKVNELRRDWKITRLVKSTEEADSFWKGLVKADRNEPDFHDKYNKGETRHQQLKHDLEELSIDPAFGLPLDPNMWLVMFKILVCLDLDKVTKKNIGTLPLVDSLSRTYLISINNRLYLDVTFAGKKDIDKVWRNVRKWQGDNLPYLVEGIGIDPHELRPRVLMFNLLKFMKLGRPTVADDKLDMKAARLRFEERIDVKKIAVRVGDITKEEYYYLPRSRRTEERVKRGKKLMDKREKISLHKK